MPTLITFDMPFLAWDAPGVVWDGALANAINTMPNDNRISAEMTAATKTAILGKIAEIKALMPYLLNLTKEERVRLPKFGPQTLQFDEQRATYMASSPNLIPPFTTNSAFGAAQSAPAI
jgi:hypothetical protein